MRFQSALFGLVVVLLNGSNLFTLVEGGVDYNNCITENVDKALTKVTTSVPGSAVCTPSFRQALVDVALPSYTDMTSDVRHDHMMEAFKSGRYEMESCLRTAGISDADITDVLELED
ncbi:hypothetical protein BGX27_004816, partial [Mortierella sp. AM989]